MKILYYGLQRSGTNFLETLLKKKYRVRLLNDDWDRLSPRQKHFRLYDDKAIMPSPKYRNDLVIPDFARFESLLGETPDYYLVISKDPYSWLLSYKSWADKCEWPQVKHHYIQEYNLYYGKWLSFARQTNRIVFIRYIDILQDPDRELARIAGITGMKPRRLNFFSKRPLAKVEQSDTFTDSKVAYYLNHEYIARYSDAELDEVNRLLDKEVLAGLGYQLVSRSNATL